MSDKFVKTTAIAPANIAFVKYWGYRDEKLFLPYNSSISMNLDKCLTSTTVAWGVSDQDEYWLMDQSGSLQPVVKKDKGKKFWRQIDRIKQLAGVNLPVKIVSRNSFPHSAGIASSASAAASLTLALLASVSLDQLWQDKTELSRQVRLAGSGSAVRSVFDGFVEYQAGGDHQSSHAYQLADESDWQLVDVVAVVQQTAKQYSSTTGHRLAAANPFFQARIQQVERHLSAVRQAIAQHDFDLLGQTIEADTLSMHAVMLTSQPALIYWQAATMELIHWTRQARAAGLPVYFTIDAGANVHLITLPEYQDRLVRQLKQFDFVKQLLVNYPAKGACLSDQHLF